MTKQTAEIVHLIALPDANATTRKTLLVKRMGKVGTNSFAMTRIALVSKIQFITFSFTHTTTHEKREAFCTPPPILFPLALTLLKFKQYK